MAFGVRCVFVFWLLFILMTLKKLIEEEVKAVLKEARESKAALVARVIRSLIKSGEIDPATTTIQDIIVTLVEYEIISDYLEQDYALVNKIAPKILARYR